MVSFRLQAGPVELLDKTVCSCAKDHYGPTCSVYGETEVGNAKCEAGYCKNGGLNVWAFNNLSGCRCVGTQFFVRHCDHDKRELCAHVDYDGMTDWVRSEMNATACGECLWHSDCNTTNAICAFNKTSAEPHIQSKDFVSKF